MEMTTPRRVTIALGVLVVLVGAISLASIASGSASARSGTERFMLTDKVTGPKASPIKVVASGPIHGVGTAEITPVNSRTDRVTLRLANGSVHMVAPEKRFTTHLNLAKCTGTNIGHGTFTITGGSRAFRGVVGHGTYHRTTVLTGARSPSGKCLGSSAPPSASTDKLVMTGTVNLH